MRKSILREKSISFILAAALLLSGCSGFEDLPAQNLPAEEKDEFTTLGLSPEFDYEVPESLPSILVDQVGYACRSSKMAMIIGEEPPEEFVMLDAKSSREVYTGQIEQKGYDETLNAYISYADFTDYNTPGSYYIQASSIGRSYVFAIAEEPYAELFQKVFGQYYCNRCGLTLSSELAGEAAHNACHSREAQMKEEAMIRQDVSGGWHVDEIGSRDVAKGCQTVNTLLLAYELYPDAFGDDLGIPESGNGVPDLLDEVKYEIDWLFKMQDAKSGAVYASVSSVDNKTVGYILYIDGITMDATIHFAAAMARFSYLYQSYDLEFATRCLKAADRAYRYAEQYLADISQEQYFHAAAELYRATGNYQYHNVVKSYLEQNREPDLENDYAFWGCVTYLSTRQTVDMNLCSDVIQNLMRKVETISYDSKASKLLVKADEKQGSHAGLLRDMTRLTVVDHIITNHEYATVLENHIHYMLGRNLQSIAYLNDVGGRNYRNVDEAVGVMNQVDQNAELLLMLAAIMDDERVVSEE
ncbi:MAG: glycoside hydrolase family 9 protein [Bacteroidales bacterium]|nr:glycoside hydrolase family 9 protein [Bacteroidales bacterium]MCM1416215.1 glycoside hydrolase family 9 protein [bacterium]MCM1424227.1 glycoside hydrolase family 9 protein [bacterium]